MPQPSLRHPDKPAHPLLAAATFVVVMLLLAGCAHEKFTDYSAFVRHPAPLVTSTEYRLAPPDEIIIASKRVRELNGHAEQIRPDGKITLPLLGTWFVAGKTPEQVSAELQTAARDFYQDADVSLRVIGFNSKKVYVWGEVAVPGPYSYNGTNTVFRTLAYAQPTRLANTSRIDVLRPNHEGKLIKRMTINLDKMVQDGDIAHDAVLEEGDVLYVPPTALASVGLALQQLLLPIQPAVSTAQGASDLALRASGSPLAADANRTPRQ
ncbi:MAG: polysaccharide biosynthesis/export family protein [Phycisphaeraceae bacterium]